MKVNKTILAIFILSTVISPFISEAREGSIALKIIGGVDSPANLTGSIVSIHFPDMSGGHGCGGTLIAPNWVLTAAHCVDNEVASGIQVYGGLYRQSESFLIDPIAVKRFIQHPEYNSETLVNDIALLELESAAQQPQVTINSGGQLPSSGFVLGWGLTSVEGQDSDSLQYLDMPIVTNAACSAAYEQMETQIYDNQICAGYYEGGKDTCQNDSGGPLYINTGNGVQQVGIVSFGDSPDGTPCAGANSYGVYTRISSHLDFISQYVSPFKAESSDQTITPQKTAKVSESLTIDIPSILWNNGQQVYLSAKLVYIGGTQYSFAVDSYSIIKAVQNYASSLSSTLELNIPNLVMWNNQSIWVVMRYDPSYQDRIVFSLVDMGSN